MLKLTVVDSHNTNTEVDTSKLTISASNPDDGDSSSRDVSVSRTTDGIEISIDTESDYADWYQGFIDRKTIAMQVGGSDGDLYNFEEGYNKLLSDDKKLSAKESEFRRVRSVANVFPNEDGDLLLLPSKNTDVVPVKGGILVKFVDDSKREAVLADCYEELTLLIMRLYHTINHLTARILVMSPNDSTLGRSAEELEKIPDNSDFGKLYGTLLNYQATLARWNFLVWSRSFSWDISESGPGFAISIGYTCLLCSVDNVKITTTIKVIRTHPVYETDPMYAIDSSSLLTLYKQGVADTRGAADKPGDADTPGDDNRLGNTVMLKRWYDSAGNSSPNLEIELSGFGFSDEFSMWNEITIEQTLGAMKQADMCSELFSLFPANNAAEADVFMQSRGDENVLMNEYEITTVWNIYVEGDKDSPYTMERSKTVEIPALSAIKPEEEASK